MVCIYAAEHSTNRYEATLWVYQCAVVSALFTILQVPYTAIIMSKERMGIYAYMSILEAVLRLGIVYTLLLGDWDKLKLYAVLNAVTSCTILSINILYCIKKVCRSQIPLYLGLQGSKS